MKKLTVGALETKIRVGSALFLFLTYCYGVFSVSAFSDDYPALVDPAGVALHSIKDARPIAGFGGFLFFSFASTVGNLWILRLIGLIGLITLSDLINRKLLRSSNGQWAVYASTLAFTSISFQFFVHWASPFLIPWAAVLSLLGLKFWLKGSWKSRLIGIVLLLLSLLIYPLLSFFVFSFFFVAYFFSELKFSDYFAKMRSPFLYLASGGFLLYFSLSIFRLFNSSALNQRVDLVSPSELPTKIFWFISRPIALGFRPFSLTSPTLLQLATVALPVIVLLMIFALRRTGFNLLESGKLLLGLFVTMCLSLTPLLITSQNEIDFRLVGSVKWLIETLLIAGFFQFLSTLMGPKRKVITGSLAGLLAILSFYNVNHTFENNFKSHYLQEVDFFEKSTSRCSPTELERGVFIVNRTKDWPSRPLVGVLSQVTDLASEWVPVFSMKLYIDSSRNLSSKVVSGAIIPNDFIGCVVRLDDFTA